MRAESQRHKREAPRHVAVLHACAWKHNMRKQRQMHRPSRRKGKARTRNQQRHAQREGRAQLQQAAAYMDSVQVQDVHAVAMQEAEGHP